MAETTFGVMRGKEGVVGERDGGSGGEGGNDLLCGG